MDFATSVTADELPASARSEAGDSVSPGARPRGVDYAALWRQVEAESARVVVVDIDRLIIVAGRLMTEAGDKYAHLVPEAPLNRMFPEAETHVQGWSAELDGEPAVMVTHSLSPRHWIYFWRIDSRTAVLAAVRHRYGRGAVAAGDTATIRLLCEHWLTPEMQAMGIGRAAPQRWNRMDRRARAAAPSELWGALLALCLATACGLWLAAAGPAAPLPVASLQPVEELQRLARLSDRTLERSLGRSLAERDLVEVQKVLDEHLAMGHFSSAMVANERRQVVAHAGLTKAPEPTLPPSLTASAPLPPGMQTAGLRWGDAAVGQLLTVPVRVLQAAAPQPAAPAASATPLVPQQAPRWAGALLALVGLLSGARLWRHLRARYR